MKIGKVLAVSAVSGILMGVVAGCGGDKAAAAPAADPASSTSGEKANCSAAGAASAAPAGSAAAPAGEKQGCASKNGCKGAAPAPAPKAN